MTLSADTQKIIKIALADNDAGDDLIADVVRIDTAAAVAAVASPTATDLASAILVANECKTQLNLLIAALADA